MGKGIFTKIAFVFVCLISLCNTSFAQTITTGTPSPAAVCQGGTLSVPFTTTGTLTGTYKVQLSDAAGLFTTPVDLVTTGTATPLTATIPASTAAGTGYKIRVVNSAPVTNGTEVALTVVAIPAAPSVTASVTYCQDDAPVALSATATGTNTLKWYNSADAPLPSIPTVNTATAGTTIYKVAQVTASGACEGLKSSISVLVNPKPAAVTPAPASYTYCIGATATDLRPTAAGAAGNTLKWYDAGNAEIATPTIIPSTAVAGTTIYYVGQVNATTCRSSLTAVSVSVVAAPATPTVTPTVSFCIGDTPSTLSATPAAGTTLKWYDATDTALPGAPSVPTTAAATLVYKVSQITTTGACESSKATITVTVNPKPAAVAPSATSYAYCIGATATDLFPTATATTGNTIKWFNSSLSPIAGTTIIPSTTGAGSTDYYVGQANSSTGCVSELTKVTVVVSAAPAAPIVANIDYCKDATAIALTATTAAGNTARWYADISTSTFSTTAPVPLTTTVGDVNYYVSQVQTVGAATCESSRAVLKVTTNALPAVAGTTNIETCQTTASAVVTLSAVATSPNTIGWYAANTGGSRLGAAPTVNTATAGITTYYAVQVTAKNCESPTRTPLAVTVKALPAAPTAVASIPYCINSTATPLSATPATGGTLTWYTAPTGTTGASATAPTPLTTAAGVTKYYVSQTINGCEGPRAEITVTVYKTNAPTSTTPTIEYCVGATPVALNIVGSSLKYYTVATGGTGVTTPPTISTAAAGTQYIYVSQTLNSCESQDRLLITVIVKTVPVAPTVTNLSDVCINTPVTSIQLLNSVTAATGVLNWYSSATSTEALTTAPAPVTTAAETKSYFVTQTVNGCESPRAKIDQVVKTRPAIPTVTTPVDLCNNATGTTALTATATGTNTLKWYDSPAGVTALAAAPIPLTTTVGTTNYYVAQVQTYSATLSCEGPRTLLAVTVNPLPAAATTTNYEICQTRTDQIVPLTATATSPNTIGWYSAVSGGSLLTAVPTINYKTSGTSTYYAVQITAKNCQSPTRTPIIVKVKPLPALPTVTSNIEYCQFDAAIPLSATLAVSGTPSWYTVNPGGTASSTAPTPSTAEGGTTSYYVSQTVDGCEGDRAQISVLIKTTPRPSVVSPVTYCQNATATALNATGTALKWYLSTTDANPRTNALIPVTTNVGDYAFYVTQTGSNGCESPKQAIDIRIRPFPSATISGDQSINLGGSATIKVDFTGDGPWTYTVSPLNTPTTTSINPVNISVSPQRTTTYLVTGVSNSCGSGTPIGRAMVTVLIPTISTGNPNVATQCAGKQISIPFQASGTFVTGNEFKMQISRDTVSTHFFTIPSTRNGNDIIATLPDTISGGNYYIRVSAIAPNVQVAGSISASTVTIDPLPIATISGSTTIYAGGAASLQVTLTGKPNWTFTITDGTTNIPVVTSVTPYIQSVSPTATSTFTITRIENACGVGRTAGQARIQVDPILGVEPTTPASRWVTVLPTEIDTECVVTLTSGSKAQTSVELVDALGRSVQAKTFKSDKTSLSVQNLPIGQYFLRVKNGDKSAVFRLLKTK